MTPSAAPVTSKFPLWLKAVQLMATGSGSKENWSWETDTDYTTANQSGLDQKYGNPWGPGKKRLQCHATCERYSCTCSLATCKLSNTYCIGWLITCCLTVLVSQSSSCPEAGMGSRGTESQLPDRLRAAAEQTNEDPLGLQARDRMLRHMRDISVLHAILRYMTKCSFLAYFIKCYFLQVQSVLAVFCSLCKLINANMLN